MFCPFCPLGGFIMHPRAKFLQNTQSAVELLMIYNISLFATNADNYTEKEK